jgi:ABC-2 type transport system permease protein
VASAQAFAGEVAIYRRLVAARLRGQMHYKRAFLLQMAGMFLVMTSELLAIFILFAHFDDLAGWTVGEVAFLYALSTIAFGLAHLVGSGFAAFQDQIRRGEFDRVLVRPVSPFTQTLASDLHLHQFGRVLQGLVAFAIALTLVDLDWTPGRILYLPIVLLCATICFTALFTLEATLCFWTTEATEVVNAFTYGGTTLAQYPFQIYDRWLRGLFLWIIPIGLVIFEPALYLLGKDDPLGLPRIAQFSAPLAAAALWVAVGALWRIGVRHYRSTGS